MKNIQSIFIDTVEASLNYWIDKLARPQTEMIDFVEADQGNLYRAIRFALKYENLHEKGAETAISAFRFISIRGYFKEWQSLFELICKADLNVSESLLVEVLNRLGQLYRLRNLADLSYAVHQEAFNLAVALENRFLIAQSQYNLGEISLHQRKFEEAEHFSMQALIYFRENPSGESRYWLASINNTLGEVGRFKGDYEQSERCFKNAIDLANSLNNLLYEARFCSNLSLTYRQSGKLKLAIIFLKRAVRLVSGTLLDLDLATFQLNMGVLHASQNNWHDALASFSELDLNYLEKRAPFSHAMALMNLGHSLVKANRVVEGISYLKESVYAWTAIDSLVYLGNAMGCLAEALEIVGDVEGAYVAYKKAVEILQSHREIVWVKNEVIDYQKRMVELELSLSVNGQSILPSD